MRRHSHPSEVELARLADDSLPAARRLDLRARVDASPDLARALAEQQQVASLLRSVDEAAPPALRRRVEAMTAVPIASPRSPRRLLVTAGATLAVVAAAVAGLTQGGRPLPSVSQTAQLALATPTAGAPAEDAVHPGRLAVAVDRVAFPYWRASFGWRAVGTRTDVIRAQRVVTVYYADPAGVHVGYSIVAGAALPTPAGRMLTRRGVRFSLIDDGGLQVVTWRRSGHTCVLAGRGIGEQALLRLASDDHRRSASA